MNDKAITPYNQLKELAKNEATIDRYATLFTAKDPSMSRQLAMGFLAGLVSSVYENPQLREADPTSIILGGLKAAKLGLALEPNLGQAWLVPYKVKGVLKAQFQIGYKGYIQLALRTDKYKTINVEPVFEGEEIIKDRITGELALLGTATGDEIIGWIGYLKMNNGYTAFIYKTRAEIMEHAARYSRSYGSSSSPWTTDFDKMARKTVLKELLSQHGELQTQLGFVLDETSNGESEITEEITGDHIGDHTASRDITPEHHLTSRDITEDHDYDAELEKPDFDREAAELEEAEQIYLNEQFNLHEDPPF